MTIFHTKTAIKYSVTIACFVFVSWQSFNCIKKYIYAPQGTQLSLQYTAKHQFPAITLCQDPKYVQVFDSERLYNCGISNTDDYQKNGKWFGSSNMGASPDDVCQNPAILFESIVAKPTDVFKYISYRYFDKERLFSTIAYATNKSSKIWSKVDTMRNGRCFTFTPTDEMIKFGIRTAYLQYLKPSMMFFHTNGMFKTSKVLTYMALPMSKIFDFNKHKKIYVQLNHEIFNMLDVESQQHCNNEPDFNQDLCNEARVEETSLSEIGCTTPFGPNKNKICRDQENGSIAIKHYSDMFDNKYNNCYGPCSFVLTKAMKTREVTNKGKNFSSVLIYFDENIKVTDSHYLYSGLSLIAEIGGYVGLFLGVSVNQVSVLMNTLLDKIDCLFNQKKEII